MLKDSTNIHPFNLQCKKIQDALLYAAIGNRHDVTTSRLGHPEKILATEQCLYEEVFIASTLILYSRFFLKKR